MVANIRLAGFAALALTTWFALRSGSAALWILAGGLLAGVIALVAWHAALRRQRDRLASLETVNVRALSRLDLTWSELPPTPAAGVSRSHPYARDLDVVGDASLARRISTPVLTAGWSTLYRWLLSPSDATGIARRQRAVWELSSALDQRQAVEAAGPGMANKAVDPEPFLTWASASPWLLRRPWLWIAAIVSPLTMIVLAALFFGGAIALPLWLLPIAVNVALFQFAGKNASDDVASAAPIQNSIAAYVRVFQEIGDTSPESELLQEIVQSLGGNDGATQRISRLARISRFIMPRGAMLWTPLQMAFLWDIHVLHALERWRAHSETRPRDWFARAGEWEALAALSILAHDHPGWSIPNVDDSADRIEARALAHPLIHHADVVANDVEVGPNGTFLFVTGSNMSGKSTLLRAIGLNAVLAMAGGPVAADRMLTPIVNVWTCMRVEDSLERGVSFFMAELERLKAVVDAAVAADERPVLYLLDEILQGTNTVERQIASRQVLAQLDRCDAIGAVSSHDLGLISDSALEGAADTVHFAEEFTRGQVNPQMTFDYRLRQGLATTTNALALMELLGFDVRAHDARVTNAGRDPVGGADRANH